MWLGHLGADLIGGEEKSAEQRRPWVITGLEASTHGILCHEATAKSEWRYGAEVWLVDAQVDSDLVLDDVKKGSLKFSRRRRFIVEFPASIMIPTSIHGRVPPAVAPRLRAL